MGIHAYFSAICFESVEWEGGGSSLEKSGKIKITEIKLLLFVKLLRSTVQSVHSPVLLNITLKFALNM